MRNRPDALMIFAAGKGTRMLPLTADRPKPLIEVAGRPLIDIALALAGGFRTIVVNTHYRAPQLAAHLEGRAQLVHEPDLLETGGGLKNALPLLGPGPVATLNSDAVWSGPNPLALLAEAWDPGRMEALVLVTDPARSFGHSGGDFAVAEDGRITRGGPLIYSGAQVIDPRQAAAHPETVFSMNVLWDGMIRDGTLYGLTYPGHWCDVGRPEGIALAEEMLRSFGDVRD